MIGSAPIASTPIAGALTRAASAAAAALCLFAGYSGAAEPAQEDSQVLQVFEASAPPIELAATGAARATGGAGLSSGVRLAASASAEAFGSAAVTTGVQLAGGGQAEAAGTAAMSTGIALQAAGAAEAGGSAVLETGQGDPPLVSAFPAEEEEQPGHGGGYGALLAVVPAASAAELAADGRAIASGSASLSTGLPLGAQAAAHASGSAALDAGIVLAANGRAVAAGGAQLDTGLGDLVVQFHAPEEAPELQSDGYGALLALAPVATNGDLGTAFGYGRATGSADLTAQAGLGTAFGYGRATGTAELTAPGGLTAVYQDYPDDAQEPPEPLESLTTFPLLGEDAGIDLAASGAGRATGSASLSSVISLAAGGRAVATATANLGGGAVLQATGYSNATGTASLTAGVQLAAHGRGQASGAGELATAVALQAFGRARAAGSADLTATPASWAAAGYGRAGGTAALTTGIRLDAAGTGRAQGGASLGYSYLAGMPRYIVQRIRARNFEVAAAGRLFTVSPHRARIFEVDSTMSKAERQFDYKDPTEKVRLTFNFTPDLPDGVTLAGVQAVSFETKLGTDGSPSAMANGSAGLDVTGKKVIVPVQGGLDGCDYKISVRCSTTDSDLVLELDGILPVRA